MKFRLLGGGHNEGGKLFKKGDIVESARNLVKLFENKFERIRKGKRKKAAPADDDPDDPEEETPPTTPKEARGKDVSADFPLAVEEGFSVFRKGSWFHVFEGDETSPLNPKGIKRTKVEEFITTYLED